MVSPHLPAPYAFVVVGGIALLGLRAVLGWDPLVELPVGFVIGLTSALMFLGRKGPKKPLM